MAITAHGGELVNRVMTAEQAQKATAEASGLQRIAVSPREACDIEMIGCGAFSPLTGFVGEKDFHSICDSMTLTSGSVWSIPVTCSVDQATADTIQTGQRVALTGEGNGLLAILTVEEKYAHDKRKEAQTVYLTEETAHPGVAVVMEQGDVCLAGPVEVLPATDEGPFPEHQLTPAQTREAFSKRGWRSIVAFQTRNPIHRAHEYLTKCALEICDGLLIHPLVGQTQAGDIPADVRMQCYKVLIEKYYQPERTLLAVMPSAMRYAGPREAIMHAIIRQNYGCTHFIVGRDHAGVGNYYGTYDAQTIFDKLPAGNLAITPLRFEHSSWCNKCEGMVSAKTCPHPAEDKIFLSGTKVREMLSAGELPPMEFTRPEIAQLLIESMRGATAS